MSPPDFDAVALTRHGAPQAAEWMIAEAMSRADVVAATLGERALDMLLPAWVTVTADIDPERLRSVVPLRPPAEPEEAPPEISRDAACPHCGRDVWRNYLRPDGRTQWKCLECKRAKKRKRGGK